MFSFKQISWLQAIGELTTSTNHYVNIQLENSFHLALLHTYVVYAQATT